MCTCDPLVRIFNAIIAIALGARDIDLHRCRQHAHARQVPAWPPIALRLSGAVCQVSTSSVRRRAWTEGPT